MALRDWLSGSGKIATANSANIATVGSLHPGKNQAVAVAVQNEKVDIKPVQTVLQHDETGPDDSGVSKDSSLAAVCTGCKRIEMIDLTAGTGNLVPGCLYPAVGSYPDGWKLLSDGLKECIWADLRSSPKIEDEELPIPNVHRRGSGRLSQTAQVWLHEHRQDLRKKGWTAAELYRRNKAHPGIAWLTIWNKPGLTVDLTPAGFIEFAFPANEGTANQTARPINQGRREL